MPKEEVELVYRMRNALCRTESKARKTRDIEQALKIGDGTVSRESNYRFALANARCEGPHAYYDGRRQYINHITNQMARSNYA